MEFSITLDPASAEPLYLQIANHLRATVAAGQLARGARLPSARALAAQLGIARGTVDAAYDLLAAEGATEPRGAAGTVVSKQLTARVAEPAQRPMPFGNRAETFTGAPRPFRVGLPALDAFPHKPWSNLVVHAARAGAVEHLAWPDPAGHLPLRQAIAKWLGAARGIVCSAEQVLIVNGFQGALALARQVLVRPGDPVWVEDPGYSPTRQALEASGAKLVPVRVDRDGMRVAAGIVAAPKARLVVVTPAHQSPLGVALSLPRRLALLDWAAETGAWVLEDDFDGVFRHAGHPLPALKSLDRGERVIYAGSFSKTLFPGLRLGYLVAPAEIADAFLRAGKLLGGVPALEQRVVAAFIESGGFVRHLKRMRVLYSGRRRALAAALNGAFGDRIEVEPTSGGLHLLARFPGAEDDGVLVRRALAAGLAPSALSALTMAHDAGQGLLLGFGNISEIEAEAMAARLAAAIG